MSKKKNKIKRQTSALKRREDFERSLISGRREKKIRPVGEIEIESLRRKLNLPAPAGT
jgi:hypothetical protein